MKNQSPDMVFDTVVLRFTRQIYYNDDSAFQLEVRQSPAPLPGGAFQADITAQLQQLQDLFAQRLTNGQFFSRFQASAMTETPDQDSSAIGQHLYTLLPLTFQQAFPRLIQSVFEKGHGLRLILEARAGDKADRLLSLPWELLFFADTGVFLARSPRVLVVRRLMDAMRRGPLEMTPPFNIVHVIAHTLNAPQHYGIDDALKETEQEKIPQAIRPGVYRQVADPGSLEQLLGALREQPYHIMHFLGHGEVLTSTIQIQGASERGYLRFVNADSKSEWVSGEQLQHLLEFTPALQLIVLNACHGGASVARSVALELVYHGLPYVVAIQGDILQEAARYFIGTFYAELQRGHDIAYAVAVGRSEIAAHLPQTLDWCLPVLYTSVGIEEPAAEIQAAERLWQWMSHPKARQRLGIGNLFFGALHLLVGLLLFISQQTTQLPRSASFRWVAALFMLLPIGAIFTFYWRTPPKTPAQWVPVAAKLALLTRVFGAASLGIGIPSFYTWLVWLWFIAVGFWKILTPVAQNLLLGAILIPGMILGWKLSHSQILGHAQAFISEARIAPPKFEWGEIAVILGGYMLLTLPWALCTYWPHYVNPPLGNMWISILLLVLGYMLYTEKDDR